MPIEKKRRSNTKLRARRKPKNSKIKARNRRTLSISDAALHAGFGRRAMSDLVRSGEVPGFRVGRNWYILRTTLDEWLDKRGGFAA